MSRMNALLIALLIGVAAVAGTFAVTRTTHLGAAAQKQNAALIAQRQHRVAAGEAALRKALAQSPPAAAVAPRTAAVSHATATPQAVAAPAATGAQRVVYVRPAPIVIHKHRAGGESESRDGAAPSGGGGFDD
jgi:hypothetical protein